MGEQPGVRPRLTLTAKPAAPSGPPAGSKMRADLLAVEQGLFRSRNRAQSEIRAGNIFSGDKKVESASDMLDATVKLTLKARANPFVSRGALKLVHALDHFGVDPKGKVCLDVGASTGGFTQVLIQRGAKKVFAVDVGTDQLAKELKGDARIVSLEKTDARNLTRTEIVEQPDLVVADVSFISLQLALPRPLALAAPGAELIALVKPQFEAGRGNVGKGVVRDTLTQREVVARIGVWLGAAGWTVKGTTPAPVTGGDGNQEFLLWAAKPA
ncbi:16S/23S rRNA (cytidine-2'-O)-methyltransferase TlyA [Alphaproteobacteria bacterium SO-S41]|nr:16S/23S rRNA (cytidine-2'-O)-methyltransferase TlyA [Alphaproteobacteria bacterium SO-S41]